MRKIEFFYFGTYLYCLNFLNSYREHRRFQKKLATFAEKKYDLSAFSQHITFFARIQPARCCTAK